MPDKILTIAGSDSLSGGGIQADLATFSEYGYFGLAVTTAIVTVTTKDFQVFPIAPHIIAEQLNSVLALDDIRAIKIGFLPTVASIEIVAEHLQHIKNIPIIVDPVMAFKETQIVDTHFLAKALTEKILPFATILTPNLKEAEILSGHDISDVNDMRNAAKEIFQLGPTYVVIKGGSQILGNQAVDVLYDGHHFSLFKQDKIVRSQPYHSGAGCSLSASLAANLSQNNVTVNLALSDAKDFVWQGIKHGVKLNDQFDFGNVWQGARRSL